MGKAFEKLMETPEVKAVIKAVQFSANMNPPPGVHPERLCGRYL